MAIQWRWDDKCGEAIIRQKFGDETKEFTVFLYTGNCHLIFLNEWEEDKVKKYSLYNFWADKEHMKICLGLGKDKDYDNMYDDGTTKLVKIRLNKKKCKYTKDIVNALVQAFDDINIEIFSEEK